MYEILSKWVYFLIIKLINFIPQLTKFNINYYKNIDKVDH